MQDKNDSRVIAVMVTYNRKKMLEQAIESIKLQTRPVDELILVDNDSDDGTQEYADQTFKSDPHISYYRLPANTGGAGGFNYGIKKAFEKKADFIWLLDDDIYADKNALHYLIQTASAHKASFYCSHVMGVNKYPMNLPDIDFRKSPNGYSSWNQFADQGIIKVNAATFVSVLIPCQSVRRHGFPIRQMFIWGDDGEYTLRLSQGRYGLYIAKSRVEHRRVAQKKIEIFNETQKSRISLFFYFYRNNFYISKTYKTRAETIIFVVYSIMTAARCLQKLNFTSGKIILKGLLSGLFFNPTIEKPDSE